MARPTRLLVTKVLPTGCRFWLKLASDRLKPKVLNLKEEIEMNPMRWRLIVGGLLVVAGVVALINAITGYNLGGIVWALLLGLSGLAFVFVMASHKSNWWAAIPGFTLLGIAALVGLESLAPNVTGQYGGALVLGDRKSTRLNSSHASL